MAEHPEVQRRPGGRSARVRAAVNQAVIELLAEQPYESFSVDDVAKRAGVHKTTVYRRWPTKVALVADATRARSESEVPIPDTGSLQQDLELFCSAVAKNLTSVVGATMTRNLVAAAAGSAELHAGVQEFWAERLRMAAAIVTRAVERGEVPPDLDPNVVIETLVGPLYVRLLLTGEPIDDEFVTKVATLVAHGGSNPPTDAPPRKRRSRATTTKRPPAPTEV